MAIRNAMFIQLRLYNSGKALKAKTVAVTKF